MPENLTLYALKSFGVLILVSVFAGIFILHVKAYGMKITIHGWAIAIGLAGAITAGVFLMFL